MATPQEGLCDLLQVPPEVWMDILKSDALDGKDIYNVSLVCRELNEIACSNDLWKTKFNQRWPKGITDNSTPEEGWKCLYKTRQQIHRAVEECVREVADKNYHNEYISNEHFEQFAKLMELHNRAGHFIVEELFDILESPRHTRLTDKFYAAKAVKFVQQQQLKRMWEALFSAPEDEQLLETGALYVSWWMQMPQRLEGSEFRTQLDGIANRVRDELKVRGSRGAPPHPACSKDNNTAGVRESLWTSEQNMQVLKAMNKVLYQDMGLQGNDTDYYTKENSFIDKVIDRKKGIPITLSIIYHAVALRLGVLCQPTNFPNHFILAFANNQLDSEEDVWYIDAFNKGRMLSPDQCMHTLLDGREYNAEYFHTVPPHTVCERMARNLVCLFTAHASAEETIPVFRDAVALFLAISPHDQQMIGVYSNLCLHLGVNLPEVIEKLQSVDVEPIGGRHLIRHCQLQLEMRAQRQQTQTNVKIRSMHPEVSFSVGMVMKHKRYDYTCVIYGWDSECRASREWILQMGVHLLAQQQHQPFYNVLVEDGSMRYAAQESLEFTREVKEITHPSVGRYFQEFTGRYYVPNPNKHTEYPDDTEVTATLVNQFFDS